MSLDDITSIDDDASALIDEARSLFNEVQDSAEAVSEFASDIWGQIEPVLFNPISYILVLCLAFWCALRCLASFVIDACSCAAVVRGVVKVLNLCKACNPRRWFKPKYTKRDTDSRNEVSFALLGTQSA